MERSKVLEFAKENGYRSLGKKDFWNGYDIYEPLFNYPREGAVYRTGPPLVILVEGNKIRMSTVKECFEYLDYVVTKNVDPEEEAQTQAFIEYLKSQDKKKGAI